MTVVIERDETEVEEELIMSCDKKKKVECEQTYSICRLSWLGERGHTCNPAMYLNGYEKKAVETGKNN